MSFWRRLIFGSTAYRPRIRRIGTIPLPIIGKWWAFQRLKWLFPIHRFSRHGYLVGKTGSGKSELLKMLFLVLKVRWNWLYWKPHILQRRTVILLDPHGDTAEQCARQPYFHSRKQTNLVYLCPKWRSEYFPSLNPFDLGNRKYHSDHIALLAESLTRIFTAMISKGDVTLSLSMRVVLTPILLTLLWRSQTLKANSTFLDVERFLDPQRNVELVRFGATKIPFPPVRQFFRSHFHDPKFSFTKFSLRIKLASLIHSPMFCELLCQQTSSFDLGSLLNSGKTIVINASKSVLGEEVTEVYGRTITALVRAHAFLRSQHRPYPPMYFLIDEAPTFVSDDWKSMLAELRKFGVHLILAQQTIEQDGMSPAFHHQVLGNTGIKIVGDVGSATRRKMAEECEVPEKWLRFLPTGTFLVKHAGGNVFRALLPRYWRDQKSVISETRWKQFRDDSLPRYYRKRRRFPPSQ